MRAVDLAVMLVEHVQQTRVCPWCPAWDEADAHDPACPLGQYESSGYKQGKAFQRREPQPPIKHARKAT